MSKVVWSSCALLAMLAVANPSSAGVITYGNLASWQAATVGVSTTTFEENAPGTFTFKSGGTAVFGGATFSTAGNLFTVDPDYFSEYSQIGTGDVLSAQFAPSLSVSGGGVTALAFDWQLWDTQDWSVTLSTGDVIHLGATAFVPGFLGITSTTPITGLTMNFGGTLINIDNFAVGRSTAKVPEPASLFLLGSGLAGMVLSRRRARRQ